MSTDWAETYRRVVLGHHRQPHNRGPLPDATHEALGHNVLCGDRIDLRLKLVDEHIEMARFEAEAGALSIACASMLTERVLGMSREAASHFADHARAALESAADAPLPPDLGDLAALAGVRAFPSRRRAVTLPIAALQAALAGGGAVTTET
ncbi:MAG: iron-sulfur cluster assembly scaffold protein [Lysobacterales bacterium]